MCFIRNLYPTEDFTHYFMEEFIRFKGRMLTEFYFPLKIKELLDNTSSYEQLLVGLCHPSFPPKRLTVFYKYFMLLTTQQSPESSIKSHLSRLSP